MDLPQAGDAAAWFVETARRAVQAGEPLDAAAVQLLMTIAPGDPAIAIAIERLAPAPDTLATFAHDVAARLRDATARADAPAARAAVSELEAEVLRVYRPGHGLGSFADDAAVAVAMLSAYHVGADDTHLMMAEELMLGALRRDWHRRLEHGLEANCDAALALSVLTATTGKAEYRDRALEVMHGYAGTYRSYGVHAAPFVAVLRAIS